MKLNMLDILTIFILALSFVTISALIILLLIKKIFKE